MTMNANPDTGSDNLDVTSLDNPDNWNYYDPDEDGEVVEVQGNGTESEAETELEADETAEDEVEAKSDQDDDETDEAEESDEDQPEAENDETEPETFTLPNGDVVERDELIAGYMKEADYRRKTTQVAETRKSVEASAQLMQRQIEVLTEYLAANLPQEPDASLAYTDPNSFTAQKAVYDQQLGNLQKLLAMAETPKQVGNDVAATVTREKLEEENAKLRAAFPQTAKPDGRKAFFESAFDAANQLGFSDEEIQNVSDSRIFGLAYYAKKGMAAEKAAAKAKQKVASAPKAAPKTARVSEQSNQAMKRLRQSGSIHDAVMVDFE